MKRDSVSSPLPDVAAGPHLGHPLPLEWVGMQDIALLHGDVVVWGGADRLRFHGVAPLKEGEHALLGAQRINLTFRKAG